MKRNKGRLSRHACIFPVATTKSRALAQYGVSTHFSLAVILVGYQLIHANDPIHSWHFLTNNFIWADKIKRNATLT